MNFRRFVETLEDWQQFAAEIFGDDRAMAADFQCWLRNSNVAADEFDRPTLERFHKEWMRSRRRGRWCDVIDRKRRQKFTPGRFWAASPAGVYLNQNYVKGWRGINPRNP